jgi:hypothetical protein
MAPGSAGCYVAVCGRSVRAAASACPPGPRCSTREIAMRLLDSLKLCGSNSDVAAQVKTGH